MNLGSSGKTSGQLKIRVKNIAIMLNNKEGAGCAPQGFKASALACGLKKNKGLDLGLIYSEVPAVACGAFTKNKFSAAPVKVSREHLKSKSAQAIIVNSGNANCYTGKSGLEAARGTTSSLAELLKIKDTSVLVASTGIIGKPLDFLKIKNNLERLVSSLSRNGSAKVAQAIMTTDTKPKELLAKVMVSGAAVTIGAIAKGAGMIAPDMATMLCFITTDAKIEYRALQEALAWAVENSFNRISIDGCMSTNDSVIILANGLAKNKAIVKNSKYFTAFRSALGRICLGLAKMIVQDAEGATKFIVIDVSGAKNDIQAKKAALAVANSNLFKTAVYGENQNWGRIIAAIGAVGVEVKETLDLKFSSFKKREVRVKINLKVGQGRAIVYTSDLTPEYIRINAEYN